MEITEEIDQFRVLEEKVDSLINAVHSISREKESLVEKINLQEEKIASLNSEIEQFKANNDNAKLRIGSLLEKIDQLEF